LFFHKQALDDSENKNPYDVVGIFYKNKFS